MSIEFKGMNPHKPGELGSARKPEEKPSVSDGGRPGPEARPTTADTVTITPAATRLRALESGLPAAAPVDSERVAGVHAAVSSGSYSVDPERVAEKLIAFEQALRGKEQ